MTEQIWLNECFWRQRLKQREKENTRLKKLVGEQALDFSVLKDVLSKNFYGPSCAATP